MGGQLNRRMGEKGAGEEVELEGKAKISVELNAYEEACKTDADVRNFDDVLQARTGRVIHALAHGVEVRTLSLESLREVTTCLLEMDQEVVRVILEYKKDIWNTPELFELVQEYFDNSLQTLDFCTVLENCLRKARDNQLIIQIALQHFPGADGGFPGETECQKVLEELAEFKTAGSPFPEEFLSHFNAVYLRHKQMLEKLHARRSKLDKKLKNVKAWRKISNIIFASTFATVLICSVVAAAMAAPPVAAALGAAASIPIGSMGKWVNSLWSKYEDTINGQREIISAMHVGTFLAIKDLDTIRVLVDRLESTISSLVQSVEFCLQDREAVLIGIEHIKSKQECFVNDIEDLFQYVDRCSREIRQARTLVVQKIIKVRPTRKRSFSF